MIQVSRGPSLLIAILILSPVIAAAQAPGKPFTAPKTAWESDTLVVETTNFNDQTKLELGAPPFGSVRGIGDKSRVIERFTRTDANTVMYEFTIDDPTTYTKTWTAQTPWVKTDGHIFEYACHEGNYALTDVLSGERAAERASGR